MGEAKRKRTQDATPSMIRLRWVSLGEMIPGIMGWAAQHPPHGYVIGQDGTLFSATYRDQTTPKAGPRFVCDSLKKPFATMEAAQDACASDLKDILRRRH